MTSSLPAPVPLSIPMRDGVRLACDVYGLAAEGAGDQAPRPVLLERTPYGRADTRSSDQAAAGRPVPSPAEQAAIFLDRGFIYVRQDCRGRGDSQGVFTKYHDEARDGLDTITWLRDQPWCDGHVSMTGVSYSAHAQTAAAGLGAPLAAMIMDSGGLWHPFESGIRVGGAYELKQATWAMRHALRSVDRRSEEQRRDLEAVDISAWFARMPWRRGDSPLTAAPEYEDYLFDLWGQQVFDAAWQTPDRWAQGHIDSFPAAPAVVMGSWYDPYVRSSIPLFTALSQRHPGCRLIMGPWTHGARATTHSGDVEFGPQAAFDAEFGVDAVTWRADWLADPSPSEEPVRYFVMGGGPGTRSSQGRLEHGGQWRRASAWPPPEAEPLLWHLGADGSLGDEPAPAGTVDLRLDPAAPTPTRGGQVTSGEPVMRGGAYDHAGRAGVVSFRSEPLTEPLTIAGGITLSLRIASTAADADVTATLIDEYPPSPDWPDGFAMNLSDTILRASYRQGYAARVPLTPGEPTDLRLDLPDVANRFEVGHRIRIDVASSNFPRFDLNPGTCGEPWDDPVESITTVNLGEGRASIQMMRLPQ